MLDAFKVFDSDDTGTISAAEFTHVMSTLDGSSVKDAIMTEDDVADLVTRNP